MNQTKEAQKKVPLAPKVPVASVDVRTEQFESAHGRKPRGRGYWMFGFGSGATYQEVGFTGGYAQAKRDVQLFAAARGCREVTVLS